MATRPRSIGGDESRLAGRLKWMMFVRLAVSLASLAAFVVFRSGGQEPEDIYLPPYITLTAACVLNLGYLFLIRGGFNPRPLAVVQHVVDTATVTALVYFLGPQSVFAYFYFAVVIGASAVSGSRAAIGVATMASLSALAVSLLYYAHASGALKSLPQTEKSIRTVFETQLGLLAARAFFFSLGLYALAFLAGRLSEEVSRVRIVTDEILQNMAGGVMAVDRTGAIAFTNPQALLLLGIKPTTSGIVGRPFAEVLPKDLASLFRRALAEEDRIDQEIRVGEAPVHIGISRLADGRQGVRGVVAIVNDLSLRMRAEQMAQRAERFRALLEMSAGMAHEIRNPLASIRGAAQELGGTTLPGEDDRKLLEVVIRESDRLDQIITDFLEYASDRPLKFSLVNLPDLLQEVVLLLEARDPERRMRIQLELPRTLVCRGDPDKLKQVFLNLGLNSLDAVGKGGALTIRALPAPSPSDAAVEGARVEFEDTGSGIPADVVSRIFDPFFTTKPGGTGMGLAIARKILQGHDGSIGVNSVPGKGATFRVWLPGG